MSKCEISWAYLDRLNDVCDLDPLERIMGDLREDMQRQADKLEESRVINFIPTQSSRTKSSLSDGWED